MNNGSNNHKQSVAHKHRVVITGMGLVTPLGHNVPDSWAAIKAGKSGTGDFVVLPKGEHEMGTICEVKDFDADEYLGRRDARRRDRFQQLATVAAREAFSHASLEITDDNRDRIGITLGTGVGGIQTLVEQEHIVLEKGLKRVSPFAITMIMPNGAAGMIAIDYGIHGPSTTITTSTGLAVRGSSSWAAARAASARSRRSSRMVTASAKRSDAPRSRCHR